MKRYFKFAAVMFLMFMYGTNPGECIQEFSTRCVDGKCGIVNKINETVIPYEYEDISVALLNRGRNEPIYLYAKKDGKYGLINANQDILIDFVYDEIEKLNYMDSKFIVKKDDKYGVIEVIDDELKVIHSDYDKLINSSSAAVLIAKKDDKMFLIGNDRTKQNGKEYEVAVISEMFDYISDDNYYNAVYLVRNNDTKKANLLKADLDNVQPADVKGYKTLLPKDYDDIKFLRYKYYQITDDGKNYLAKIDEDEVVFSKEACTLRDIVGYDNYSIRYFICEKDGKLGLINSKFETVLPFEYETIELTEATYPLAKLNGKTMIIEAGTDKIFDEAEKISFKDVQSFAFNKKGDNVTQNYSAKQLKNMLDDKTGYLAKINDKYGIFAYTKSNGYKEILPFEYDEVKITKTKSSIKIADQVQKIKDSNIENDELKFVHFGGAICKNHNKYGFINENGEKILNTDYDYIYRPWGNKSYLFVRKDGKYATYNLITNHMSDFKYENLFIDRYGIVKDKYYSPKDNKYKERNAQTIGAVGNYVKNGVFCSVAKTILPEKYGIRFYRPNVTEPIGDYETGGAGF